MSLQINNVTKYFADKCILKNFSYTFDNSGIYAIVGDSGVGKTTLLRMIASLDKNYSGNITGGGFKKVSFAFQEYRLFPQLTALENVVFSVSDRKNEAVCEKARDMLLSLGINEADINLLPDQLSGGMKQRVSIARALISDAEILLLDEPTKELDSENCDNVLRLVKNLSQMKLVIIVSHNEDDLDFLNAIRVEIPKI